MLEKHSNKIFVLFIVKIKLRRKEKKRKLISTNVRSIHHQADFDVKSEAAKKEQKKKFHP
jgi:hypothetical protein